MVAIITKYHGPSNARGSRITASTRNPGQRISVQCADNLSMDENHERAARQLCTKYGWYGRFVSGTLKDGSRAWCLDQLGSVITVKAPKGESK